MDQLAPTTYSSGSSEEEHKDMVDQEIHPVVKCPPRSELTANGSAETKDASKESQSDLPNTAKKLPLQLTIHLEP